MSSIFSFAFLLLLSSNCIAQNAGENKPSYDVTFNRLCLVVESDTVTNLTEPCRIKRISNEILFKGSFNKKFQVTQTIHDVLTKVSLVSTTNNWQLNVSSNQVKCVSPDKSVTFVFKDPIVKTASK